MRVLGPDAAEMPLLTVRPEVRGSGLGTVLLCLLENALAEAGVGTMYMPGLPPLPHNSLVHMSADLDPASQNGGAEDHGKELPVCASHAILGYGLPGLGDGLHFPTRRGEPANKRKGHDLQHL